MYDQEHLQFMLSFKLTENQLQQLKATVAELEKSQAATNNLSWATVIVDAMDQSELFHQLIELYILYMFSYQKPIYQLYKLISLTDEQYKFLQKKETEWNLEYGRNNYPPTPKVAQVMAQIMSQHIDDCKCFVKILIMLYEELHQLHSLQSEYKKLHGEPIKHGTTLVLKSSADEDDNDMLVTVYEVFITGPISILLANGEFKTVSSSQLRPATSSNF